MKITYLFPYSKEELAKVCIASREEILDIFVAGTPLHETEWEQEVEGLSMLAILLRDGEIPSLEESNSSIYITNDDKGNTLITLIGTRGSLTRSQIAPINLAIYHGLLADIPHDIVEIVSLEPHLDPIFTHWSKENQRFIKDYFNNDDEYKNLLWLKNRAIELYIEEIVTIAASGNSGYSGKALREVLREIESLQSNIWTDIKWDFYKHTGLTFLKYRFNMNGELKQPTQEEAKELVLKNIEFVYSINYNRTSSWNENPYNEKEE